MNSITGSLRHVLRATCALTIAGVTLTTVPITASAAPIDVVQAPAVPQVRIGLSQGSQGNEVRELQRALVAQGVSVPGGVDGIFGPLTRSALITFQKREGIAASGKLDQATASALGLVSAPAAPAATSTGGLAVGSRGEAVKQLQRALMSMGVFVRGGADGVFGPATEKAVTDFQRWNNLSVTGRVDATTASRLKLGSSASPAPAASTSGLIGLRIGARGDDVKTLQRGLIAGGANLGRVGADGVFGSLTDQALRNFQRRNGLPVDGVVSQAVVDKLPSSSGSTPAAPAASSSNAYVGMQVGSRGSRVQELQRALMNTGLSLRGGADGVFGNMTKATLIAFQRTNGTSQTGVVSERDASVLGLGTSNGPQALAQTSGFAVFGERGDRVRSLQRSLLNAGISFVGGADGMFGAATSGAIMAFQRREGLAATGRVDQATANLLGAVAAPAPAPPSTAGIKLEVFPMQGRCWFGDTWHAPRSGGRLHQGVDIIGAEGKLLYAVVSGEVTKIYNDRPGALAGNGLRIAQPDGTYFTYLHLQDFAEGIEVGAKVTAGQVIGYNGNTGSSATPHLHFEVHPKGGAAVNPYPFVKAIDACNVTAPRG